MTPRPALAMGEMSSAFENLRGGESGRAFQRGENMPEPAVIEIFHEYH